MLFDDDMTATEPRTILLLFANDRVGDSYLRNLPPERRRVERALSRLAGRVRVVAESNITRDRLFEVLREHGPTAIGVHFGGHAHPDALYIEDDDGRAMELKIEGLAGRLAEMPNLRWVFLNGCATRAQVASIHRRSKATVIATTRSIRDDAACEFAAELFANLVLDRTLDKSFAAARDRLLTWPGEGMGRFLRPAEAPPSDDEPPWRLVPSPRQPDGAAWRLTTSSLENDGGPAQDSPGRTRAELISDSAPIPNDEPLVFIAHAAADAAAAQALKEALAAIHIRGFIDKDLPPGELWDIAIPRAQSRARLTAVILSEHWPRYEEPDPSGSVTYYAPEEVALGIAFARRHPDKHRLVPIRVGAAAREMTWYGLSRLTDIVHQSWAQTAREIARALDHPVAEQSPARPALIIEPPGAEPEFTWVHLGELRVEAGGISPGGRLADLRRHLVEEHHHRVEQSPGRDWPDAVFVTGDLTADGSPAAYAGAVRWLRELAEALELPLDRVFAAPGPADLVGTGSDASPAAIFAAQTVDFGLFDRHDSGFTTRTGRLGGLPLRVVGLDTAPGVGPSEPIAARPVLTDELCRDALGRLPHPVPLTVVLASHPLPALEVPASLAADLARTPCLWFASGTPGGSIDGAPTFTAGGLVDSYGYACGRMTPASITVDLQTYRPSGRTFAREALAFDQSDWPKALSGLLTPHRDPTSRPVEPAPQSSRRWRAFDLLGFDRKTQWHEIRDALEDGISFFGSVVGQDAQAVHIFLDRIRQRSSSEHRPVHAIRVEHRRQGSAATPASARQWHARILEAARIAGVATVQQALGKIARRKGVLIVIGPLQLDEIYAGCDSGAPTADLAGLRELVASLPELADLCGHRGLRVVFGARHSELTESAAEGVVGRTLAWLTGRRRPAALWERWTADLRGWLADAGIPERGQGEHGMRALLLDPLDLPDVHEIIELVLPHGPSDALVDKLRRDYPKLGAASLDNVVNWLNSHLERDRRSR